MLHGNPWESVMNHRHRIASVLVVAACAASCCLPAAAARQAAPKQPVLASIDALFAAMATHDVAAARRLLVPGASFVVLKAAGTVAMERDVDFLEALGSQKGDWRERIWNPQVLVQGDLAQVWAPYDFHLDGKLSHCGIDSFSLVKDASGWRIAGISYSVQIQGCAPSPLDAAGK